MLFLFSFCVNLRRDFRVDLYSMDPLSLTASLIAIGTLAKQALKLTQAGISRYKNAPSELLELSGQVNEIAFIADAISSLCESSNLNVTLQQQFESTNLEGCLDQTLQTLNSIADAFTRQIYRSQNRKTSARVKWAFYKESQLKEWNIKLQRHLLGLAVIFSILNL